MVSWGASRASRARRGVASDEGSSAFSRTSSFLDDEDESAPDDDDDDDDGRSTPWSALASSTLNLTMTAVGSVVLSLPRAYAECGWAGGTLALAVVALVVDASLVMLVGAARSARADSYEAVGTALLGPRGGALVRVSLVVLLFGSLVSLQIIIADLVVPVVNALGLGPWASRERITAVSLAIVYPLTLADNIRALASASAGAFVILVVVAGVVVARFAESGAVAPDVSAIRADPTSLSLALPVIALAYTCHFNVIEIDRELPRGGTASGRSRDARMMHDVVHAATLGVSLPFYAVFSLAGYATFGANVSGDLLTEWTDDGEMAVAQAAVAVVNALKYPLVGFALRGATTRRAHLRARVSPREDSDAQTKTREERSAARA